MKGPLQILISSLFEEEGIKKVKKELFEKSNKNTEQTTQNLPHKEVIQNRSDNHPIIIENSPENPPENNINENVEIITADRYINTAI